MPELMAMDGLTVVVERPPAAARPPILLIHGYLGGAWYFEKYQGLFAELGYPSYAVNLRGHHGSRPVADVARVPFAAYVEDALEVARRLAELERGVPPIVIGHSMGGLIAQKVAEAGMARALVLLCPAPPRGIPLISPHLFLRQLRHLPNLVRSRPIVGTLGDSRALILNRTPREEHEALDARFVAGSARTGLELLRGVPVDEARVRCPVLAISASHDRFVPPDVVRKVAAKYGAPFREYFGHAHFMIWEPGWDEPAREIEHWLDHALGLGHHATPGIIHLLELRNQRGKTVQLAFRDGHTVNAKVIAVDFEPPAEIIYEVRSVVEIGPEHLAGVRAGRVTAVPLDELRDFR